MRHYGQTKICVFQVTFNIKIVTVGRELSFSLLKVFTWGRWGNNIQTLTGVREQRRRRSACASSQSDDMGESFQDYS